MTPDPIGLEGGINLWPYVGNNPVNFSDPRGLISHILVEIIVEFFEFFITPSLHTTTAEDQWMASYRMERERELYEERIRESGLREALEVAEALNKRLDAIISIYKNEFLGQGCQSSKK